LKTVVITGASSGIGAEAARQLSAAGWQVAVVGRNRSRTEGVAESVGGTPFIADFDRLDEVRALAGALAATYPRIDALANNAGGLVSTRGLSADGFERTFQHNHLAPFLLTNLLLPRLLEAQARVVSTASVMNLVGAVDLDDLHWSRRRWFGGWRAYGTVKLETILFARELSRRTGLEAYSFHPGYVATSFGAENAIVRLAARVKPGGLGIAPSVGAAPLVHLVSAPTVGAGPGAYFDQLKPNGRTARQARLNDPASEALAAALWQRSATLVGL
jgi:NAD(P)-dependent dehydrogenase (short-subunit alcohol dehydrogenase family)